jgi:hypothetical protein
LLLPYTVQRYVLNLAKGESMKLTVDPVESVSEGRFALCPERGVQPLFQSHGIVEFAPDPHAISRTALLDV